MPTSAFIVRGVLLPVIMAGFLACGPKFPAKIPPPKLKTASKSERAKDNIVVKHVIYVEDFADVREDQAIAFHNDLQVLPLDDLSPTITEGIRDALADEGFEFSDTAPVVLTGQLRTWKAKVEGGFSAKIESEASLYVEILDPANKRMYGGVYNGFSTVEGTGLGKKQLEEALRISAQEAIKQVVGDAQLQKLLKSF